MYVVATAGHVDHGKSTLVRALTGTDPDRWAEEHRRGLTIDLGYVWTDLPSGEQLAFVDVPGHRRFIGNMLAGVGPVPAVMVVVAADEGWRQQSAEHLAAVDALGIAHGLLVVTRSDLADPGPALAQAREHLAAGGLADVPALAVSARTGAGLPELREALATLVAGLPAPRRDGRVRLWLDRSFTITGAGTVVTGTLGAGTVAVGDELDLAGRRVRVRGVQSLDTPRDEVGAVARVALNLRGVETGEAHRGQALLTPGAWRPTNVVDARVRPARGEAVDVAALPRHLMLHVGTAGVPARVRPLGGDAVRITLADALPLVAGDRAILRDPGDHSGAGTRGVVVLDVDPPDLRRRGDAARRARTVAGLDEAPDLAVEVTRRGVLDLAAARALGADVDAGPGVRRHGDWFVSEERWSTWAEALAAAVARQEARDPLDPGLPLAAAARSAGLAAAELVAPVAADAGLEVAAGRVRRAGARPRLPERAEAGLRAVEARFAAEPFAAPEQHDLTGAGLGTREIAAAAALGRVLRLEGEVLLHPQAAALAMRELAALPQPFTTSQARQALGTTRRVAIPLLEHLDARGWTRRLDAGHREVAR